METLSDQEIEQRLENLDIWGLLGEDTLATSVEFESYKEACFFAYQVFSVAEEQFHHPKITVEYGKVNIDVKTHEADGLTEKDFEFAEAVQERLGDVEWS